MREVFTELLRQSLRLGEEDYVVQEILGYNTRLYEAGTVETLAIWGGNRGFKDAVNSDSALQLATTVRLAFGEGDIIDSYNDEYDREVLKLLELKPNELEARVEKGRVFQRLIPLLDTLIFGRFEELHPASYPTYSFYRKKVEEGQAEDIHLHLKYLKGEFDAIRNQYSSVEEIMGVLVKKLGLMGECIAQIVYKESGGEKEELMEALSRFYLNAGVLLQFWGNDVQKLWSDLDSRDTNPLITYAICRYRDADHLDRKLLLRVLHDNRGILDQMTLSYFSGMKDSLEVIKKHNFDGRTHQGLALAVKNVENSEKARLFRSV